jgi:hypothetical protein
MAEPTRSARITLLPAAAGMAAFTRTGFLAAGTLVDQPRGH